MPENKFAQLSSLLQGEIAMVETMLEILASEKEALISREYEALEKLAKDKEDLSAKLETSCKARIELLQLGKHGSPQQALQTFLADASQVETDQIRQLNMQLIATLEDCREKNIVNGQVIVSNMNTRQELVNLLSGQSGEAAVNVYTSTGDVKQAPDKGRHEEA
ncbi:flagella synthesis protein FlgN [Legionella dresdenensis]|uniref:Flagella synthesis protein FlgN n=1 Tax=Legionella dresdenensis TaxID=450200 RepID=A0ABV8CCR4_9GAMM